MMQKTLFPLVAFSLALATATGSSLARGDDVPNNGAAAAAQQQGPGVQPMATSAKIALLYAPGTGTIRSKNVINVTSPQAGVYCITPSITLNVAKAYPMVSVEWGFSFGNSLAAVVRDTARSNTCVPSQFEVRTFDFTGTPYERVAFILLVN